MSITPNIFRVRFPEFTDDTIYPDERVQLFIDDAALIYMGATESRWGAKYDIAQAYLTAHLLTAGTATEAGDTNTKAGEISSKSAGGVSVTRAIAPKNRSDMDSFLTSTSYGQYFLNIRNTCFVGVMVANSL